MHVETSNILIALCIGLAGMVAGFLIEVFLFSYLRRKSAVTKWKYNDLMLSLKGLMPFIGLSLGTYLSSRFWISNVDHLRIIATSCYVLAVVITSVIVSRILVALINRRPIQSDSQFPVTSIMANITRIIVYLIGLIIILQAFGKSVAPILTALGVGGIAIALALQETLANLFSGLQIIASQKVRIGDYVKLASGEEGYVTDITWRNTIIRQLSNNIVIIPNTNVSKNILVNYSLFDKESAVLLDLGVSYDDDLLEVEKLTERIALETMERLNMHLNDFKPFIRYHTFGSDSIQFTVILRVSEITNKYLLIHEFIKALNLAFQENGITIPLPQRVLQIQHKKNESNNER